MCEREGESFTLTGSPKRDSEGCESMAERGLFIKLKGLLEKERVPRGFKDVRGLASSKYSMMDDVRLAIGESSVMPS